TSKTLTYGSQYGTLPTPTRTGYTFNGWYTAASGGTKVSSTTTIGASNTTIYAHWTKKLTYELVDGPTFNSKLVALMNKHLSVAEWEIIFTDQKSSGTLIHDFDKDGDGGIVAWVDENELIKAPMKGTVYISTQNSGQKVIANENSREMFAYRQKLTSLDVSNLDTSKVTDMSHMLAGSGFTSLDLSNFNTSNVTNMQQMFSNSYSLTSLDISNFNTSKVTNMLGMFKDNFSLTTLNLSNFNTSNVTNMGSMFNGCVKLTTLNLSNFNTSKVTNMNSMFSGCEKLTTLNLSNFNTSNVTNMNSMFNGCIELSSSITIMNPTITNYSEMFTNCSTASNSKFIVNYIDNTTKSVARKMVATKSYNSKVFLY
ncbi:BspA family leucine-rich repeat surface protein, partial [Clostridium sp.]|uniref:BspA family leucine-rich repeat surface protein n=1 Tax=Clostridium sp. TaxID=1506 RepID=UPI0028FE9928